MWEREGVWLWKRRQDGKRTKEGATTDPFFSQRPCEQETLQEQVQLKVPCYAWPNTATVLLNSPDSLVVCALFHTWELKQSITFSTFCLWEAVNKKDQTSATMTNWMKKKSHGVFNMGPLIKTKKIFQWPNKSDILTLVGKKSFWYQKAVVSNVNSGCRENQRSIITQPGCLAKSASSQ